jgi:hypothetical protein
VLCKRLLRMPSSHYSIPILIVTKSGEIKIKINHRLSSDCSEQLFFQVFCGVLMRDQIQ